MPIDCQPIMEDFMRDKLESALVGVAGEYFVAAELSLRGFIASITLRNTRGIDIIASKSDASSAVSLQIKSNSDGSASWILTKNSEGFWSNQHFYVFVALRDVGTRPDYFVVPSKIVSDSIINGHSAWLAGKKSDGSQRKDSSIRKFTDYEGRYLERWDLLGM